MSKESGNIGSAGIPNTFSTSTIYESTNNTERLTAKFTKLTPNTTPTEIYNKPGVHNNIKLSLYYGTNTNSLMREGKYELDILYTIVSNTPTSDIEENNTDTIETSPKLLPVRENQTFYKDNTITIKTNIKANKSITPADITININNKPCTDITITKNFQDNTNNPTNTLELTCKAPQNPATQAGNKYDLNLTISKYNINTTKKNAINYVIPTPMQTFQYSQCTSMNEHEEKLMIDTRDNELYTMAKLKDGKCWMTQNLRYQLDTSTPLTPSTSDVSSNWTPNHSTETTVSDDWSKDTVDYTTVRSYYDSTKPEYGTYYTHNAATAGTVIGKNVDGYEATGSICPKGWRLPRTGTEYASSYNDFYNLSKEYKGSAVWTVDSWDGYWYGPHQMLSGEPKYVLSGLRSGIYVEMKNVGSYGHWWSSTVGSWKYAYGMKISSNSLVPLDRYSIRDHGFSVRCLAREPKTIGSIEYMQDMTPKHCANSSEHQTATLKDKRDSQTYTVAKLKDGKCWMTQNLRLKLSTGTSLKPEDSDVTQNWTPNRSTETTLTGRWDQDSEGTKTVRSYYDSNTYSANGVYYTHTAVTAGTTTNMDNDGDEATGSICPKGWRLPKAGYSYNSPKNEFYNLSGEYEGSATWQGGYWSGSHQMISGEPKCLLSGFRNYSSADVYNVGSNGWWWSSTVYSSNYAYNIDIGSSSVNPRGNLNRYYGFSVRCLAR